MTRITFSPHRKRMSRRQRLAVFIDHDGVCCHCRRRIRPGEAWQLHHIDELADGGADEASNMRPIHDDCHAVVSGQARSVRAKVERVAAKHLGMAKARPGRPLAGSRASPWKKKISGEVVRREK